jgi:tetratricopeptide (TPR) repeat protein
MPMLAEGGFARAALQSGCRFSAGLAEARALIATGRPDEAERVLATLVAPSERGEVTLALVRARNLFFALNRTADAEAVLDAGERTLAVRGLAGGAATLGVTELHALRARFAFAQGDPRAALAMAAPVEADPTAPDAARVRAAVAMAEALAVCGRRDEAIAVARRWEPACQRQLAGAQALAQWLAGSLPEATYEAERAYAAATDPHGWAVAALLLGHVWLSRGDTDAALRWFRESSVLLRGSDPVGMRPAALAGIAQAAAQAGDSDHAQKAIAELDRMPHAAGRGVGEELGLARAWAAHATGDHGRAVVLANDVVATAEARGADGFAARARAELTRLRRGSDPSTNRLVPVF